MLTATIDRSTFYAATSLVSIFVTIAVLGCTGTSYSKCFMLRKNVSCLSLFPVSYKLLGPHEVQKLYYLCYIYPVIFFSSVSYRYRCWRHNPSLWRDSTVNMYRARATYMVCEWNICSRSRGNSVGFLRSWPGVNCCYANNQRQSHSWHRSHLLCSCSPRVTIAVPAQHFTCIQSRFVTNII